jgi:hypothetical protein
VNDDVPLLQMIVSHIEGHHFDNCTGVLGVEQGVHCWAEEVFFDVGDVLLHLDVHVHADCIIFEDQSLPEGMGRLAWGG